MSATQKLNTGRSSQFVDSGGGAQGPQGNVGFQGPQGFQGNVGAGVQGPQGNQGSLSPGFVDGILSGTVQAGPGAMQVQSSSLVVNRSGNLENVPDTTLNVTAADATNPRVDMIQWDGATLSLVTGTPATISTMTCPSPTAGNIPIALIFIYPNGTTIRNLGQQDATGQFNAIFAYYYARRGLYAALLARQSTAGSLGNTADPVVALPIYQPRSGMFRFDYKGTMTVSDGTNALGLQCIPALDGTSFTGSGTPNVVANQAYVEGPLGSLSSSAVTVAVTYTRAQIAAGAHRWNPMLTNRSANSTLNYRQAELQEIL